MTKTDMVISYLSRRKKVVRLFICLSIWGITQKVMTRLWWHVLEV